MAGRNFNNILNIKPQLSQFLCTELTNTCARMSTNARVSQSIRNQTAERRDVGSFSRQTHLKAAATVVKSHVNHELSKSMIEDIPAEI